MALRLDEAHCHLSVFRNPNNNDDGRDARNRTVWETYKPDDRRVLLLESDQITLQAGLRDRQCDYWRNIVPHLRAVDASAGTYGLYYPYL